MSSRLGYRRRIEGRRGWDGTANRQSYLSSIAQAVCDRCGSGQITSCLTTPVRHFSRHKPRPHLCLFIRARAISDTLCLPAHRICMHGAVLLQHLLPSHCVKPPASASPLVALQTLRPHKPHAWYSLMCSAVAFAWTQPPTPPPPSAPVVQMSSRCLTISVDLYPL
ncbi:hypothetical protein K431DRAFT_3126 [Polychaeton citri CBS 116435]|uniref:Uncharacterized protein n=1 Tax=Polychaeton citri CBS 116435 TaxID=1314669 RepID=A0A9P4UTJ0_9PEZI|nr:hypothetical protein K431DRAFT_3126 [Polychaeton citri CBS 116435]